MAVGETPSSRHFFMWAFDFICLVRFPKYNGLFFYLNLLQSCLNVNVVKPTFSFESKVAALADVGSHISVRSYVFLEHTWLLTTNTTLFTYILSPTTASHIHIFLIGLIPDREKQLELSFWCVTTVIYENQHDQITNSYPPSKIFTRTGSACRMVDATSSRKDLHLWLMSLSLTSCFVSSSL